MGSPKKRNPDLSLEEELEQALVRHKDLVQRNREKLVKASAKAAEMRAAGQLPSLNDYRAMKRQNGGLRDSREGNWASTQAVVRFTQRLLNDPEYQLSLRKRIIAGECPSIEVLLYQYAYGKPVERVQVESKASVTIIDRFLDGGGTTDVVVVGGKDGNRARLGAVAGQVVAESGGRGALRDSGPGGQDDGGVSPGDAGEPGVPGDGVVPESSDG